MKSGFTLVELLVVVAMILVLAGSVTSAVSGAQKRTKIARATTDCQEITNAILAYENYAKDGKLTTMDDAEATESTLAFILGKGGSSDFGEVPVLYNANLTGGEIRDPWGKPYRVRIAQSTVKVDDDLIKSNMKMGAYYPNYFRGGAQ